MGKLALRDPDVIKIAGVQVGLCQPALAEMLVAVDQPWHQRAAFTVDDATARHGKGLCRHGGDLVARHHDGGVFDQSSFTPSKTVTFVNRIGPEASEQPPESDTDSDDKRRDQVLWFHSFHLVASFSALGVDFSGGRFCAFIL